MKTRSFRLSRSLKRLVRNWLFALAVSCVTMLPVGFFIGEYTAYTRIAPSVGDYAASISELQEGLDIALGELEVQRTRSEVDTRALEMLRREMAAERDRMAELEEGLKFYRDMLSSGSKEGLYLRDPELVPGGEPDRVTYRFIIQQVEPGFDMVEGELSVEVHGQRGEEDTSYDLGDLSAQFGEGPAALHFRYFQAIEGEMSMPEGFAPREIVLVARTSKPDKTHIREAYPWALQERLINVGE